MVVGSKSLCKYHSSALIRDFFSPILSIDHQFDDGLQQLGCCLLHFTTSSLGEWRMEED